MKNLLKNILPTQRLGIEVVAWNGQRIELSAPLAENLNDKGTAFAGSIDSLLDLAGWSAVTLALREAGIDADVMIVKSETEYASAVRADMVACAQLGESERTRILQELRTTGRSRIALQCHLLAGGQTCATMNAGYAIIAGKSL